MKMRLRNPANISEITGSQYAVISDMSIGKNDIEFYTYREKCAVIELKNAGVIKRKKCENPGVYIFTEKGKALNEMLEKFPILKLELELKRAHLSKEATEASRQVSTIKMDNLEKIVPQMRE